MAHPHADHMIHLVPGMVLRAMRYGTLHLRTETDREALRRLSRLIGRAAHAGHDTMALMPDYVSCVAATLSRDVDWNETMEEVDAALRSFMGLSFMSASTFDPGVGRPAFPQDLVGPVEAWTAARVAEEDRDPSIAHREIQAETDRVNLLFPRVGLSFGYIGNCSNAHDDRGFMVFTQTMHPDGSHGSSTRFGDHPYAELPGLRTMVMARLEAWARDLDARLEAGTMKLRSTRHLEAARAAA